MPPKGLSPAAKQQLIISHLRSTRTCHTLKDLEKMLPSVASINGMQVKEYIQSLTDEGQLRVEKIGSGNWYWIFPSEEKRDKERVRDALLKEVGKAAKSVQELEEQMERVKKEREKDREADQEDPNRRGELEERLGELERELKKLKEREQMVLKDGAGSVKRMREDVRNWKEMASLWTDNIYILEAYLEKLAGGDREVVDAVKRECYEHEYVEGEGLRELDF
ncbi:Meiotic nuclear division protein 1 [Paecilomyces lecythidis]|uniref:Meiotic nuclear division protein 1 n=1 Tax=Paecilomyces lecythidis TaxID=3004212 RepID=A0ABR3XDM7_9EURO